MSKPLVSIIIPNYNKAPYIREAIESALNQTYKNIEVIVVDDGSTDQSREIIKSFGKKIKAYFLPHKNANVARNFGFKKSKGKYIQFLDSDDIILPEKIEKQVEVLEKTGADMALCYWESNFHKQKQPLKTYKKDDLLKWLLQANWFPIFVPLYRKKLVLKVNGWDENLQRGQDTDFHFRIALQRPVAITVPETLCRYIFEQNKLQNEDFLVFSACQRTKILLKIYPFIKSNSDYRKLLAELLYNTARTIYAYDNKLYKEIAKKSFSIHRTISPHPSKLFNLLFLLLGPETTERLYTIKRHLTKEFK